MQDLFGRRFLSDQSLFEIGESLVAFEVANYYARVGELNRLLGLRIQQPEQSETWDSSIRSMLQTVWIAQQQVKFEVQKAIDRLKQGATQ